MMSKNLKKYIWLLVYVLAAVFLVTYIAKYAPQAVNHLSPQVGPFAFLALLTNTFAFFVMGACWVYMNRRHHDVSSLALFRSFYVSQITRYIPGNVWSFLARFVNNQQLGIPKSSTAYYLAIENIDLILVSAIFAVFSLGLGAVNSNILILIVVILLLILFFVIFFAPDYLRKLVNIFAKRFKTEVVYTDLSKADLLVVLFGFILYWFLFGLSFYLLCLGIFGPKVGLVAALGINAAAWLIGYLSLLTPSGLGVREGAAILLLSPYVPAVLALPVVIVSRFVFTIAEVLGLLIVLGYSRIYLKMKLQIQRWVKTLFADRGYIWIALIVLIYIIYFSFITIVRNHNLYSGRFDLGDMDQTVWNTINGAFFQMTNPDNDRLVSRMSFHGDLMLALIAPLYWIYDNVNTLLILQSIVIGIGALPVYGLAKRILKNRGVAFMVAVSFLLYPALERVNFYDFHAVAFCVTLFPFAFLFIYLRKYWWAFLFCALAMLTKEEIGFIVFMLGLYIAFIQKDRREGFLFSLSGMLTSFLFIWVLIPHFRPNDTAHFALIFYSKYGGDTPFKVLEGMLTHPLALAASIFDYSSVLYLYQILLPVGLLSVLNPATLFLSISELLINILSNNYYMKTIYLQYTSGIIPFIFISTIFGAKFIHTKGRNFYDMHIRQFTRIPFMLLIGLYILCCSLVTNWAWGVLPFDIGGISYLFQPKEGTAVVAKLEQQIPAKYSVSATNSIAPHFTHRKNQYLFPVQANTADFIVALKGESFELVDKYVINRTIDYLLKNPDYTLIYHEDNFYVFEKKGIPVKLSI